MTGSTVVLAAIQTLRSLRHLDQLKKQDDTEAINVVEYGR